MGRNQKEDALNDDETAHWVMTTKDSGGQRRLHVRTTVTGTVYQLSPVPVEPAAARNPAQSWLARQLFRLFR